MASQLKSDMPNPHHGPDGKFCKKRSRSQSQLSGTSSTDKMSDSQEGVAVPNQAQMDAAASQDDAELRHMMAQGGHQGAPPPEPPADPGQPSGAHQGVPPPEPPPQNKSPVLCGAAAEEGSDAESAAPSESLVRQMAAQGTGQRSALQMVQEMARPLNQEQRAVGLNPNPRAPLFDVQEMGAAIDAQRAADAQAHAREVQAAEDEAAYVAAEAVVAEKEAADLNAACDAANERAWEAAELRAQREADAAGVAHDAGAAGPPQDAGPGEHPESGAMPALVRTDTAGPSQPAVHAVLAGSGAAFNRHRQYFSLGIQPQINNLILIKLIQPHAFRNLQGLRVGMLEVLEARLKDRDHPQPPHGDGASGDSQMIYKTEWRYDGEVDCDCKNGSVSAVYKLDAMKNPVNSTWPDIYVDLATAQSKAFERAPATADSPGCYLRTIPGPAHWRNNDGTYIWRAQGLRTNCPTLEIRRNEGQWHEYHWYTNRYWDPFGRLSTPAVGGRVTDMELLTVPWSGQNTHYRNPYNYS